MIQVIFSLVLLGGTGGYMLSQSLAQTSGPVWFVVGLVAFSFAVALFNQIRSVGQQG